MVDHKTLPKLQLNIIEGLDLRMNDHWLEMIGTLVSEEAPWLESVRQYKSILSLSWCVDCNILCLKTFYFTHLSIPDLKEWFVVVEKWRDPSHVLIEDISDLEMISHSCKTACFSVNFLW